MKNAFDHIGDSIDDASEEWKKHPNYYTFEPWDVEERSREIIEQAGADDVDLNAPYLQRCIGSAPHGFQTGYLLSEIFGRVLIAGNQLGKSLAVLMDILMSATGEIPFAFRYDKGVDTGVPRPTTKENIIRWGRRDSESGKVLDHDKTVKPDDSWNCGNVIGVGVFPTSKIVPEGSMIRLASYMAMIEQNWWPAFTGESKAQLGAFVPSFFIDKTKGSYVNRGFDTERKLVHLRRGVRLKMITYESEKRALEGIKVPTYLDEEPPKEDLLGALFLHASRWSLSETPWRGITYSKKLAFPDRVSSQKQTFHASMYDCPYQTPQDIIDSRSELNDKPWEIGSRIWGIPTEQEGKPYYDRSKINFWIQRFERPYRLVRFEPTEEWDHIKTDKRTSRLPGLLDTHVRLADAQKEDQRAVWRLYEDRLPGVGYVSASDQAEGDADAAEDAGDASACEMGRQNDDDPSKPVVAASLRSTLTTPMFTREVLYAARYFNNALLAPETGRGSANESFRMVAAEWPWWFKDVTIRQSTRQARAQLGFCPTTDRRDAVFNTLIRDWLDGYEKDEYPEIPDEWVLRELAGAIVGRTRGGAERCDHPTKGTLDSAMAYGILLFVFQDEFARQIRPHGESVVTEKRLSLLDLALAERGKRIKGPVFLGEGMKSTR